jgi:redox-sensitive bicupin YhaK (pirin superfamily)
MITVRRSDERGRTVLDWLDSRHTFSFGGYQDPGQMGFSVLRVINEDLVKPDSGFGTHPHRDMEIITWVVEGELEHRDTLGNGSVIRSGDLQRMSAGTGIRHSEMNPSKKDPVHFLQIWILPERQGMNPEYEQASFSREDLHNRLTRVAGREGGEGALTIHQDVQLSAGFLDAGTEVTRELEAGRQGWLQVVRGAVDLNGTSLGPGDGAGIADEGRLVLRAKDDAHILFFDLP